MAKQNDEEKKDLTNEGEKPTEGIKPDIKISKVPVAEDKETLLLVKCIEPFKALYIINKRYSMKLDEQRQLPVDVAHHLKNSKLVI